ncbi:hypothetical protein D9M68_802990 [compost metagenome]
MQLVNRIADQARRTLGLIEEQQRGIDHLFVGETTNAQAIGALRARQLECRVIAAPHGEIEAWRETVQLFVTRLIGRQIGKGILRQLPAATLQQLLVKPRTRYLAASQQGLHRGSWLAIEPRQQCRFIGKLDLPSFAETDRLAHCRLHLATPRCRYAGVAHATLLVDPGEILATLLATCITTAFQHSGIDVVG